MASSHRIDDAVLASSDADAHVCDSAIAHDRLHIGEVEIDNAGFRNQIRNSLDTLAQHVIRHTESLFHRRVLLRNLKQLVIRNDYQ